MQVVRRIRVVLQRWLPTAIDACVIVYICLNLALVTNSSTLRPGRLGLIMALLVLVLTVPTCLRLLRRAKLGNASNSNEIIVHAVDGLLDVYYAIVTILLLANLGAEVLSTLEAGPEEQRRVACVQSNAQLSALAMRLRDSGISAQLVAETNSSLPYASCDFNNWGRDSYMPTFFAFTVITTIGYGTTAPVTQSGRLFTAFYALVCIGLTVFAVTTIAQRTSEALQFVLTNLLPRGRALEGVFRKHDVDKSGTLSPAELASLIAELSGATGGAISVEYLSALAEQVSVDARGEKSMRELRELVMVDGLDVRKEAMAEHKAKVSLFAASALILGVSLSQLSFSQNSSPSSGRSTFSSADNFYYCVITFTTVGLGDLAVDTTTASGLVQFIAWATLGLGLFATVISTVADYVLKIGAMVVAAEAAEDSEGSKHTGNQIRDGEPQRAAVGAEHPHPTSARAVHDVQIEIETPRPHRPTSS